MYTYTNENLDIIEKKAEEIMVSEKGRNVKMEREPIAFGLNAIIVFFSREEILETDDLLEKLEKIEEVNSVQIIDFRRALKN